MKALEDWLDKHGLSDHLDVFVREQVRFSDLNLFTNEDVLELGLPLGPRKRLIAAIAESADPIPVAKENNRDFAEAERRQLTVMFCDLVGSTEMSSDMELEDYREILAEYYDVSRTALIPYEGYIAKYMGDGILVYFGYPTAHEDDAERAVHAGLAIVKAIDALKTTSSKKLTVRIGLATGLVVAGDIVGEGVSEERAVVGETPNLAARIQVLASPNSVMISEATHRLVESQFEFVAHEAHELKGIRGPVSVFEAIAPLGSVATRFDAAQARGLTPLSGRADEIGLLIDRWERACSGEGQAVLIEGEAGIGKSRLAQTVREKAGGVAAVVQRYQCSPYYAGTAFHPVKDFLARASGFLRADDEDTRLGKLERKTKEILPHEIDACALMAAFLGLPTQSYPALNMTPQKQRAETVRILIAQVESMCALGPILILFEDAHWIDPSTEDLLTNLIQRSAKLPIMIMITHRPEYSASWAEYDHVTSISVGRLDQADVAEMVQTLTAGNSLPENVAAQILTKTDGVPLFVEELTKAVLETGLVTHTETQAISNELIPSISIPSSLQDSLMARLDRLAPVKEVAQIGSVIGREFSYELIATVSPLSDQDLVDALEKLVDSELMFERGARPDATYTFKHALVQDAAYESLLVSRRQQVHAQIAHNLESHFQIAAQKEPEVLAHHYTCAGQVEQALPLYLKAGELALSRSAVQESVGHLHQGLAVAAQLPVGPERDQVEVGLQALLGLAFATGRGYGSEDAAKAYSEAKRLCDKIGEIDTLFPVLYGLFLFHWMRGDLNLALDFSEKLIRLVQTGEDDGKQLGAKFAYAGIMWHMGQNEASRDHAAEANLLYSPAMHPALVAGFGQDIGVGNQTYAAFAALSLGLPETALNTANQAVELARELGHPFSLCLALGLGLVNRVLLGELDGVFEWASECIEVSIDQGFPHWLGKAQIYRGWALAKNGSPDSGIVQIQEGISNWRMVGAAIALPLHMSLLADAYLLNGMPAEAMVAVDEADDLVKKNSEFQWAGLVAATRGAVLHRLNRTDEAELTLRTAIETAKSEKTNLWALHNSLRLANLWRDQGRMDESRSILTEIYETFTEGTEVKLLKEAKFLIDEF